MGGFVKVAREYDGVELVGIESPLWPKTGTGSGWITQEAYETFLGKMIAELEAGGQVRRRLSRAARRHGRARRAAARGRHSRGACARSSGRGAFIVGTFDPHGNEDEEFLRHADMAFCVQVLPALRQPPAGRARRAHAGAGDPRRLQADAPSRVKVPIISPTVLQWTGASPWMDLVQRALIWEAREPDVYVNVFFGFPWSPTCPMSA